MTSSNSAFLQAHKKVVELINHFDSYAQQKYFQPDYREAETRKDFIDPLLKALGWDVDHERQRNPYEQEVKVESGLVVHDARAQKRADYAFYLAPNFRDVRFYVEAKKPNIHLDQNIDAHFQTLRYGYSAGTPLAVLTDFAQIIVLDCRRRPRPDSSALQQVYKSWHYGSFRNPDKFAEFYWLFSREAHADGSYLRRVDELPKPRGGARQRGLFKGGYQSVDESFLLELTEYRETLAKAFKKADASLDSVELTELVQRALDRLVFMRFLEDKQIETEVRVSKLGKGKNAWGDFQAASHRLDKTYNGIVFKHLPRLDDAGFQVDEDVFGGICECLAAENSPYNFDAIPIHILGSIYERFLGSVIRATAKQVKVEEKPEVRKAGGVYYTPEYIVRYIVAQTVGKLIAGKTPDEISKMRFADIACGSGSFLLGVYDELLRYHVDWYNHPNRSKEAKEARCVKTDEGRWRLSLAQRRNILQNNIYGVDLDRQAVEVAQLSLFLKLLEEERAASVHQYRLDFARNANMKKLLPDLRRNIVCGNSLISWKIAGLAGLSREDELRLNLLNFRDEFPKIMRSGGFDAIVGNPPYVRIQNFKKANPIAAKLLKENYRSAAKGNYDIYVAFVERGMSLFNASGKLGFIVPNKFFTAQYGEPLRGLIAESGTIESIVHFGDQQVFEGATTYTCILTLGRSQSNKFLYETVNDLEDWKDGKAQKIGYLPSSSVTRLEWNFVIGKSGELFQRLQSTCTPLENAAEIFVGVQTSADYIFHLSRIGEGRYFSDVFQSEVEIEDGLMKPLLSGIDVSSYRHPLTATRYILFPYRINGEEATLLPWDELRLRFPKGAEYLSDKQGVLRFREGGKFADANWYRFGRSQNIGKQGRSKLCVPRLVNRLGVASDFSGDFVLDNVDVCGLSMRTDTKVDLRYTLGVLNSHLLAWVFPYLSASFRGGFLSANRQFLGQLPFRSIDFSNPRDKSLHDRMVALVEQMLEAKKQEANATATHAVESASRRCTMLEREIDDLVYELYGLTEEEISLVENGCA
ncbi:MAG: Eco57I restriction-modification methylase domain-containing protein [Betaproteobacteria bacterium]|nr:Eco57I restriction-modification methylase domain-containing protein [Betaproteobacteria bacterium]